MRRSSTELLALHGLRLLGFAAADRIARRFEIPESAVSAELERSAEAGFARFRTGERSGWVLTAEGRKENERLLAVELDDNGLRASVTAAYQSFLVLNPVLLAICTRWQISDLADNVLNDHQDPAYDASVIADLVEVHTNVVPICTGLGADLDRFAHYGPALSEALGRIQGGAVEWFTKPTIDSYHTAWFELHEDLLATLGLDRHREQSATQR